MNEYLIRITKTICKKIVAENEEEAIELGYDINNDNETILNVECLSELEKDIIDNIYEESWDEQYD